MAEDKLVREREAMERELMKRKDELKKMEEEMNRKLKLKSQEIENKWVELNLERRKLELELDAKRNELKNRELDLRKRELELEGRQILERKGEPTLIPTFEPTTPLESTDETIEPKITLSLFREREQQQPERPLASEADKLGGGLLQKLIEHNIRLKRK
jgi:hypothetical protein